MKKMFSFCALALVYLATPSCTPEVLSLVPQSGHGSYSVDLDSLSGQSVYPDCDGNMLSIVSGHLDVNYNIVANSNATNATAHVLLNNLELTTTSGASYYGNINTNLTAHAAQGQVLKFDVSVRLNSRGTSNKLNARLRFQTVTNANGTVTVSNMNLSQSCGN